MKTLNHHGDNESKVHSDTQLVRRTDWRTAPWYSTTQVWSWDGGDAIVVMTGRLGNAKAVVVLRVGDKVHVVEDASLNSAMMAFGINTTGWKIEAN